jgi:hypothetical protein
MKARGLRFNIKKISKTDIIEEEKTDQADDELYKGSTKNYEEENKQLQSNAKDLVAKTKRMMEEMGTDKYLSLSRSKSPKSDEDDGKMLIQSCSHRNPNLDILMSQRLVDKSKRVMELEREVKEKNHIIEKLQAKLEKKNEEVNRLNECLMKEKHSHLKLEIVQLRKQQQSHEKEIVDYKKKFEDMVSEYNNKIKGLVGYNNESTVKIKELETVLKKTDDVNVTLQAGKKELEKEYKEIQDKFNQEQVAAQTVKVDNEKLSHNVKILLRMIRDMYENGRMVRKDQNYLYEAISAFADGDREFLFK